MIDEHSQPRFTFAKFLLRPFLVSDIRIDSQYTTDVAIGIVQRHFAR